MVQKNNNVVELQKFENEGVHEKRPWDENDKDGGDATVGVGVGVVVEVDVGVIAEFVLC